jgi:hypothetical protein
MGITIRAARILHTTSAGRISKSVQVMQILLPTSALLPHLTFAWILELQWDIYREWDRRGVERGTLQLGTTR